MPSTWPCHSRAPATRPAFPSSPSTSFFFNPHHKLNSSPKIGLVTNSEPPTQLTDPLPVIAVRQACHRARPTATARRRRWPAPPPSNSPFLLLPPSFLSLFLSPLFKIKTIPMTSPPLLLLRLSQRSTVILASASHRWSPGAAPPLCAAAAALLNQPRERGGGILRDEVAVDFFLERRYVCFHI